MEGPLSREECRPIDDYENAMRWYSFDPFTRISREQATVGALSKAAGTHDVSIQARSRHPKESFTSMAAFARHAQGED